MTASNTTHTPAALPEVLHTTDVTKLLKAELGAAFPGTKFSVRRDTGTACLWINVIWTGGPTEQAVNEITRRWRGPYVKMTDPATGEKVEVRAYVRDILTHRRIA